MFGLLVFSCLCFWHLIVFAHTDAVKSVMEGDSVILNTNVTEIQDLMTWTFGPSETIIAEINKQAKLYNTSDGPDGRFRDRLKLDHQTGSLTITNTRTTDSGLYQIAISGRTETTNRFNVTVYAVTTLGPQTPPQPSSQSPLQPSPSHTPDSESLIVLISAATAVAGSLLTVAAVGMIWICRKHRKTDHEETVQTHEEEITYSDPIFYKKNVQKMEDEVVYAGVVTRR